MRDRRVAMALMVIVATASLASCTSPQHGQAGPAQGTTPDGSTYQAPTNNARSIKLPPRPRDVTVDGIDPCSLLTAQQQKDFALGPPSKGLPSQLLHNSPTCNFDFRDLNMLGGGYTIEVDAQDGIQYWLDPTLVDHFTAVTVDGFPGLNVVVEGNPPPTDCATEVSVANGQMIGVDYMSPTHETAPVTCDKSEKFAAAVMATLQTLK